MTEDIIVIGGGGFGRETLDVIEAINAAGQAPVWIVLGVVDDDPSEVQLERLRSRGYRYLGRLEDVSDLPSEARFIVGIGSPSARARIAERLESRGAAAATLVHPAATVGSQSLIAEGVVVCGGAQISTNVRLGRHAHVNPGVIIGHDVELCDYVSINPGAVISGEVVIERQTLVGAGAVVLQGLTIGAHSTVGASACVTRHVPSDTVVVGVPARDSGAGKSKTERGEK